jgi:MFS family permease
MTSETGAVRVLALVCIAVLLATSTWLSGTAAVPALRAEWRIDAADAAWITTSVQLGFVAGTLLLSALNVADVFRARHVFFVSALLAGAANLGFARLSSGLLSASVFRFLTGVALAGVYPVAMKIVASWFRSGLGWRLGLLVGALTAGTSAPFLLRASGAAFDWRSVTQIASALSMLAALIVLTGVGDGPHLPAQSRFDPGALVRAFRHPPFRYTALGYFGHMWELYAFWSLLGAFLSASFAASAAWAPRVSLISFLAIAAGAVGCVAGGWISRRTGERNVALVSLCASGSFCLASFTAFSLPPLLLTVFVVIWGVVVVSDSPQFSALAARHCPREYTGSALTMQNGIGFAVTVVSIQLVSVLGETVGWRAAMLLLAPGPMLGALAISRLKNNA